MPEIYDAGDHVDGKTHGRKRKGKRRDAREYSEVIREEKQNGNPLAAFMIRPPGLKVEIQHQDEEILLLVRRHFITNLRWLIITGLMLLVPLVFPALPFFGLLPLRFQAMAGVGWYLLVLAVVLEGFLNWYFDVFIVTDERIIDIDFANLIYKNISSTKIENIEDVTYNVSGPLPSLLNFGMVFIQTAADKPLFEIFNTPKPAQVTKLINEMILEEERERMEGRVN